MSQTTLSIGLYEQVVNKVIERELTALAQSHTFHIYKSHIDPVTSQDVLATYVGKILREVLNAIESDDQTIADRVAICNELIQHMAQFVANQASPDLELVKRLENYRVNEEAEMLLAIAEQKLPNNLKQEAQGAKSLQRPQTSIASQSLFTGAAIEPQMESELRKEIMNCERIDFLVSFVKWTGIRLIMDALTQFTSNGGKLRIITTSYIGATDYKAVAWLAALPNTEIKISYDTERTRLHAKTYVFWRSTGFSTAYIGSSNLSESAMTSGLEWNIKLSEYDSKAVLQKINATFETYWHSPEFMTFDLKTDEVRLKQALMRGKGIDTAILEQSIHYFDVQPHHYQQEILDQLEAEREIHGHYKNLVIAATGTGKTVISAFDYKRFRQKHSSSKLLFVAHRKEILEQSMMCYRNILRDPNFGGLLVDGQRPDQLDYVFVSIQSFNSTAFANQFAADYFDYIVVDEFHHAAAPSYQALLNHFKPQILLGLTATPERADGQSVFDYFDNPHAIQLRLTEAIERKLLSPFHYFGVTDTVDFRHVRWQAGRYINEDLDKLVVLDNVSAKRRAEQVKISLEKYAQDWSEIIGIGFCVSKSHAAFMSAYFNQSGVPADYLTAESPTEVRESVKQRLTSKVIHFVFVVDLYNEGVDIPEVNTVLFLRPTESLTVFLQQLGRGLRLSQGKEALTVIDFVGHQHAAYNFESRFRALMKPSRKSVSQDIESGFVHVPKGCAIYLEKVAQKTILEHIAQAVNTKKQILRKIADWKQHASGSTTTDFFEHWQVNPLELYRVNGKKATFSGLSERNGATEALDKLLSQGFARLSQVRSVHWFKWLMSYLPELRKSSFEKRALEAISVSSNTPIETCLRYLDMLYYAFQSTGTGQAAERIGSVINEMFAVDCYFEELISVIRYAYDRLDQITSPMPEQCSALELHGVYTVNMILAAVGKHTHEKVYPQREGVLYIQEQETDLFFITLNKSEADYSETTLYDDYAINETLFHWQSQSRTTVQSATGQRYISQKGSRRKVILFARGYKQEAQYTSLYTCLGLADYVSHEGSAPISIIWQLRNRMPSKLLPLAIKAE